MSRELIDLRADFRARLGVNAADRMFPDDVVTGFINAGLRMMATDYDWPWLQAEASFSTAAGIHGPYNPPADWTRTLWIARDGTDMELRQRRDLQRFIGFNGNGSSGHPSLYAVSGDRIYLAPTPSEVFTIQHGYIRKEDALVADDDQALCPEEYDDLIVCYALILAGQRLKDSTIVNMYQGAVGDWKRRVADNVRRSASPSRIRVRRDWQM